MLEAIYMIVEMSWFLTPTPHFIEGGRACMYKLMPGIDKASCVTVTMVVSTTPAIFHVRSLTTNATFTCFRITILNEVRGSTCEKWLWRFLVTKRFSLVHNKAQSEQQDQIS